MANATPVVVYTPALALPSLHRGRHGRATAEAFVLKFPRWRPPRRRPGPQQRTRQWYSAYAVAYADVCTPMANDCSSQMSVMPYTTAPTARPRWRRRSMPTRRLTPTRLPTLKHRRMPVSRMVRSTAASR